MKKIQLSLLLLTILSLSASLFAGGFALSGVGSRATSMGGAFRGLADDATAMYWNPAGLANLEENQIDLGGTFIMPSGTWDPTGTALTGVPGFSAKAFEAEKSLRSFPNLFVTMAKHPRLKYGLGVFVPYGLGTTWDLYKLPSNKTYLPGFPEKEFKSSISVIDIHPSVSYQLLPSLSAGLGLSVFQAKIELAKMSFSPKTDIYKPLVRF
jgi:long-chain fatty acid transport protein